MYQSSRQTRNGSVGVTVVQVGSSTSTRSDPILCPKSPLPVRPPILSYHLWVPNGLMAYSLSPESALRSWTNDEYMGCPTPPVRGERPVGELNTL